MGTNTTTLLIVLTILGMLRTAPFDDRAKLANSTFSCIVARRRYHENPLDPLR
jgi:hypothetical protein